MPDMEIPPKRTKQDHIAAIEAFTGKWMCPGLMLPNLKKLNSLELEIIADSIFESEKQR